MLRCLRESARHFMVLPYLFLTLTRVLLRLVRPVVDEPRTPVAGLALSCALLDDFDLHDRSSFLFGVWKRRLDLRRQTSLDVVEWHID